MNAFKSASQSTIAACLATERLSDDHKAMPDDHHFVDLNSKRTTYLLMQSKNKHTTLISTLTADVNCALSIGKYIRLL